MPMNSMSIHIKSPSRPSLPVKHSAGPVKISNELGENVYRGIKYSFLITIRVLCHTPKLDVASCTIS